MFSLWRKARRENSAASRLLGSTSLRFALHGWQRLGGPLPRNPFGNKNHQHQPEHCLQAE
ncbi:hypothetical protein [Thiolapillus sp.]|uniref:hypothetical protein n=1 Tax=Thiolapillus sp. TaxID=2017437 RepID=UPI0025EC5442|nr:hypothetical protein [Thiolapillus sp.]